MSPSPLGHQVLTWDGLPVTRHKAVFAEIVRGDWRIGCLPLSSGLVSPPLATDICYNTSLLPAPLGSVSSTNVH